MRQFRLGTTRFTNKTFKENKQWRKKHNWEGCIYGTGIPIAKTPYWRRIDRDEKIFILEMNNETNKIEGIGYIMNHIRHDFDAQIYKDKSYNRYIYRSNHRLDRAQIKNTKLLEFLEYILFNGKGHLKRGQGITLIETKWNSLYNHKRQMFLPKRMLKPLIMKELEKGKSSKFIIKKYRNIQRNLLAFFDNCFAKSKK